MVGILSSFLLWHGESLLLLFGQTPENAALAGSYLRAALWGRAQGITPFASRCLQGPLVPPGRVIARAAAW